MSCSYHPYANNTISVPYLLLCPWGLVGNRHGPSILKQDHFCDFGKSHYCKLLHNLIIISTSVGVGSVTGILA